MERTAEQGVESRQDYITDRFHMVFPFEEEKDPAAERHSDPDIVDLECRISRQEDKYQPQQRSDKPVSRRRGIVTDRERRISVRVGVFQSVR